MTTESNALLTNHNDKPQTIQLLFRPLSAWPPLYVVGWEPPPPEHSCTCTYLFTYLSTSILPSVISFLLRFLRPPSTSVPQRLFLGTELDVRQARHGVRAEVAHALLIGAIVIPGWPPQRRGRSQERRRGRMAKQPRGPVQAGRGRRTQRRAAASAPRGARVR